MTLAKEALLANGPMDTRQIVRHILAAKGMATGDKDLARLLQPVSLPVAFAHKTAIDQPSPQTEGCTNADERRQETRSARGFHEHNERKHERTTDARKERPYARGAC